MKACMVVTNGFEEVETVGTYAILRRGGVDVQIYSLKGDAAVGRFGLTCADLHSMDAFHPQDFDALILPGGPQYEELENSTAVQDLIKTFVEEERYVCALCASPTILGRAGYLKGKQYTCFTSMNEDFGGTYVDQYVVRDDKIITGRSAAASIDFGFAILEALAGKEKSDQVKRSIYY